MKPSETEIKGINTFLVREITNALKCGRTDSFTYLLELNLESEEFANFIEASLIENCYRFAMSNKSFNDASRIYFAASKAGKLSEALQENLDVQIIRKKEEGEVPTIGILYDRDEDRVLVSWRDRGGSWSGSKTLTPGDLSVYWGTHANEARQMDALPVVKEAFEQIVNGESPEWERNLAHLALQKLDQV